MRRRRSFLINFILLVLLLVLGGELLLPGLAEKRFRSAFLKETDSIENLEVKISSFPSLKILSNRFDYVKIDARGIRVEEIYLDHLSGEFENVELKEGIITGKNTDLEILISEDAINNYIQSSYPSLEGFQLELDPGRVYLKGYIKIFEARIAVQLAGSMVINGVNKLFFIPEELQVEEINISTSIFQELIEEKGFSFDLNSLGLPIEIEDIKVTGDEIRLAGGKSVGEAESQ